MDKKWKNKWITALKSGEYQQGRGALRTLEDKFCCLGVLCDLYGKEKGVNWELRKNKIKYIFLDESGTLPTIVKQETCIKDGKMSIVITLNDGNNGDGEPPKSFNEIADWIEENL